MQRWQCHLVPTNNRYHCLESLDCVLCNQLACSIVILQLITWAVNSGQLCLKKKIIHFVLLKGSFQMTGARGLKRLEGVSRSVVTLCDPMDCRPPGSSVHGILQARILERVAIPFSRGSSQPRDWTRVSCIAGRFFTIWITGKPP